MKLPRFTIGIATGVLLSLFLVAFVFFFVRFPVAKGFYESPILPFYVTEDDPNYAIFKELESPEYWQNLSRSAESKLEKYCQDNNIHSDVSVLCIGRPQGYKIYYSTRSIASIHELLTRDELVALIIDYVDSRYMSTLDPLINGEQPTRGNRR